MATVRSVGFTLKYFNKWNFYSYTKNSIYSSLLNNFHTSDSVLNTSRPIKYTTSKASQLKFIQSNESKEDDLWYKSYVILGSVAVFCIYFLCLREENDIDKMFDSNPDQQEGLRKLFHLQMKVLHFQQNKLPTEKLREEIRLLKKNLILMM